MEANGLKELGDIFATVATAAGISSAVVSGLISWLGGLSLKRILQNENAAHNEKLANLSHNLELGKSTYDRHLDLILNYYTSFYKHYRLCQRAAMSDGHWQPDGTITSTKEDFFEGLEGNLSELREKEGALRLLLPSHILEIHKESASAFNHFKQAVKDFDNTDESRAAKLKAFEEVNCIKDRLESGIREFLRVENLLKEIRGRTR